MCETIEANLKEMVQNDSNVNQLVQNGNTQTRHEWEKLRKSESANGNAAISSNDELFATPDLAQGDHR